MSAAIDAPFAPVPNTAIFFVAIPTYDLFDPSFTAISQQPTVSGWLGRCIAMGAAIIVPPRVLPGRRDQKRPARLLASINPPPVGEA
jgi:hypothetical protein